MARLLIVDDQSTDIQNAAQVARSAGFDEIDARQSVTEAEELLKRGTRSEIPLPDAILLDLNLGYESGFELVRFYRRNGLWRIPLVVWSVREEERKLCELFRLRAFVCKTDGEDALREVLAGLMPAAA